ncbi:cardiolipin synthase (CMP-forming)-like [Amphiura filiformis]|uniref:cardiolipin synthase (CMP-forming)-like n=1 Tax=Amphiura filiformis TaxID=82378 RepID=UPI003B227D53
MVSSLVCSALKLSKPLHVLANVSVCATRTVPQQLFHHGIGQIRCFKLSSRQPQMLFRTWRHPKYAALSSSCIQTIQQCQYSTTNGVPNKQNEPISKATKSRPVRTHDEQLGADKCDADDSHNDDVPAHESELESRHGTRIVDRYRMAKEKMQETREKVQEKIEQVKETNENIFTIPNFLTVSRILLSPVLGYLVISEYYTLAASLFLVTSATDVLDGWIARNFKNQQSVLGSIIDPLADKVLITVLTLSLTISGLIPGALTFIIIGRDVMLITSVFWLRYKSLPEPKTLSKYFDLTHTTVKLQPTTISKYNTLIQVALVGFTIGAPVFNYVDHPLLQALWCITATSTVLSGLSYVFLKDTFKYVRKTKSK